MKKKTKPKEERYKDLNVTAKELYAKGQVCFPAEMSTDPIDLAKLNLLEMVADFMHNQWSHWMKYQYENLEYCWTNTRDRRKISDENYDRWLRQMNTPYAELSEKEKDSDREWARKLLELNIFSEPKDKFDKIRELCKQFEYWCESDERIKDEIRGLCR